MFLQLMEMEERTCTIRLVDKATKKGGVLFFRDGALLDARVETLQGIEAAYMIFSWDEVTLSIQNDCPQKDNKINSDLQPIILEAMRLKDEADDIEEETIEDDEETIEQITLDENQMSPIDRIKTRLDMEIGERCGLEDIYQDDSMNGLVETLSALGDSFSFGAMRLGYIDRGEATDTILLPGNPSTIITVDPKCPRDKIIQVLSDTI
jgi:hypothetical protein